MVCGHCCSLANQPEDVIDRTLDLLAEAEIAIVTLPTVNMYLQDRTTGRTPRWRGVTVIQEMRQRGIRVAAAGDNCRDSFYAYGDHDVLDTFRQAVRIAHLDHPLTGAPALVSVNPAAIGKFADHGRIAVGAPARLIVLQRADHQRNRLPAPIGSRGDRSRAKSCAPSRPTIPNFGRKARERSSAAEKRRMLVASPAMRTHASSAAISLEWITNPKHWRTL